MATIMLSSRSFAAENMMSVRRHTHISLAPFVSELSYNEQQRKSIKSPLLIRSILPPSSISSPHLIHVLQIIFVSLSTKGKFYEIEHSNVPQLFNAKTGKGGQSGQSKKQLNSDCVHRISSIIHDDAALPISLRYISKHSSGFMHNSYIPGKRRKTRKKPVAMKQRQSECQRASSWCGVEIMIYLLYQRFWHILRMLSIWYNVLRARFAYLSCAWREIKNQISCETISECR